MNDKCFIFCVCNWTWADRQIIFISCVQRLSCFQQQLSQKYVSKPSAESVDLCVLLARAAWEWMTLVPEIDYCGLEFGCVQSLSDSRTAHISPPTHQHCSTLIISVLQHVQIQTLSSQILSWQQQQRSDIIASTSPNIDCKDCFIFFKYCKVFMVNFHSNKVAPLLTSNN